MKLKVQIILGKVGTPRYKDEVGNTYGKLTVLEFRGTDKRTSFWLCRCECGEYITTRGNTLRSKQVVSCGKCKIWSVDPMVPYNRLYRTLKNGAKSRNLDMDLSFDDFLIMIKLNCYLCGSPPSDVRFSWTRRPANRYLDEGVLVNGIDRVDNNKGYTKDNSFPCCEQCNKMKSNLSLETFKNKIRMIYEYEQKISDNTKN